MSKVSPKKIIEMQTAIEHSTQQKIRFFTRGSREKSSRKRKIQNSLQYAEIRKKNQLNQRQDRYDKKKYSRKRKKLREDLNIGEKVYVLAERIKKKSAPGKFYKQSVQNISYFNKDTVFTIRKKQTIGDIRYYWVKSPFANITKRFSRSQLFALKSNIL